MTNQQGAPDALALARAVDHWARCDYGLRGDEMRKAAAELRRLHYENERLAALVEAQQPATHVQNPAGIEHVAGDVSKNEPESNMTQRPAQSAAAASKAVLTAIRAANMQLVRTGDDEFMLVTYKNARAQCDGGKCGIGGYCDDCPTPQTDSQPAPEYVGNGMFKGETIEKAAEHWANWCDVRCMTGLSEFLRVVAARAAADSVTAPAYSIDADPQGIRARVAEAIIGALAFGAQGANPPPTGHWLVPFWETAREEASRNRPVSSDTLYLLRRLLSNQHTLTSSEFREELTKIVGEAAQAADSVLEDAARLDWLDQQCEAYGFQDIHEGNRWEISGAYANVREAIDAERAARKQGANHD